MNIIQTFIKIMGLIIILYTSQTWISSPNPSPEPHANSPPVWNAPENARPKSNTSSWHLDALVRVFSYFFWVLLKQFLLILYRNIYHDEGEIK